ncbi:uncharacterized protein Dana_GF18261 [Drosophila ananassae]|uniref:UDP-glucuronosyltransferase n=1 Tax=Drosophila ananassae TaxID=7217 RepID=B3LZ71_DROAN|nr:UDP-glucosyltransferase 2 [Drosophila ananassae]EDV42998.1 uncharacterized protein Dana_GF18261 [Drosophila ananassae]
MLILRWFFVAMCVFPGFLEAARILAIFPILSPSHYIYVLPYLKSLASLGHEVTFLNPFPSKEPVKNIRDIPIPEVMEGVEDILKLLTTPMNTWKAAEIVHEYGLNLTKKVFNNDAVRREILKPGKANFDLIIVDVWRSEALYGLAVYFEAPIIGVAPYGTDWKIDELVGNTSPVSYLQSSFHKMSVPDTETFGGRLSNFVEQSINWLNWNWGYAAKHEALYRKYFPNIADKHSLSKVSRDFSLIFVNQHFTLAPPRPYVPNIIEVAGLHVQQEPQALPTDLEEFIQGAGEDGVIYFSLGSNIKSKTLSQERLKVILQAFSSLPQRVLWKFDEENLPEMPSNVFISKWFPQQDILAHPKVRLFVTHGGLLSTIESIHYGTPMLGLPFFFDQFRNIEYVIRQGLGLALNFNEMTAEELNSTIHRLLTEKAFDDKVRTTSARYKDKPMTPLDTAIWWTHYVLRHKGAPHMRVSGRKLDFFTYHSLDVLGTLIGGFLFVLGIVFICIVLCVKKCVKPRKVYNTNNNKRQKLKKR